ncbi:MAG: T9SS type A sorting domain-containing protein [Prevotellaceae bacterium]|nr:T9SS type A sorting domain-containing protein [Prevotellaceae bacterium]
MKKIYAFLIGLFLFLAAVPASADNGDRLVPEYCSVGEKPLYTPLEDVFFLFDGAIAVSDGATASIVCDGETVAEGTMTASNYTGSRVQGTASIIFSEVLLLPKGKSYEVVVPAGTIFLADNPDVGNDELRVGFDVPSDIGTADLELVGCDVNSVVSSDRMTLMFDTETEAVGNPEALLYREGVAVRSLPLSVTWDWDLGQVRIAEGSEINFEDGVNYTLVLPEGSVSAAYRQDITNLETRIDFTGGYTEPMPSVSYVWCSLFGESDVSVVGEVSFYYNMAIMLSPDASLQLCDTDYNVIKEATATLSEADGQWIVTADFGGVEVGDGGFVIVIPEGTVISATGDVAVNSRTSVPFSGTTGIDGTVCKGFSMTCNAGRLNISGISGIDVSLFTVDGKSIGIYNTGNQSSLSIDLPHRGIYLVKVNGKSYKVSF